MRRQPGQCALSRLKSFPQATLTIKPVVPRDAWAVRLDGRSIGDLSLDDVAASVDSAMGTGERGLLGNGILGCYTVTIDWARGVLHLMPTAGHPLPNNLDIPGLTYLPHGTRMVVHSVYEGSAAADAGVTPGDEIITLNGQVVSGTSRDGLCGLWLERSPAPEFHS